MSFLTIEFAISFLKVLIIDFPQCRREIPAYLNDFSNRWYKRENVEPDALKEWKITTLKLLILVFNFTLVLNILTPNPKSSFLYLKRRM